MLWQYVYVQHPVQQYGQHSLQYPVQYPVQHQDGETGRGIENTTGRKRNSAGNRVSHTMWVKPDEVVNMHIQNTCNIIMCEFGVYVKTKYRSKMWTVPHPCDDTLPTSIRAYMNLAEWIIRPGLSILYPRPQMSPTTSIFSSRRMTALITAAK